MSKFEDIKEGKKFLSVYVLSTEIPLWIFFFVLDVKSDKEVVDLIDFWAYCFPQFMMLMTSAMNSGMEECSQACWQTHKGTTFPPGEITEKYISMYLFPSLRGSKQKACFLGYMLKCLLRAYSGCRKCDNRDDFRNKRMKLAGELCEQELKVHIANARKRMTKLYRETCMVIALCIQLNTIWMHP